jgi:hypothetical protein
MSFNLVDGEIVYENLLMPNRSRALINQYSEIIFEPEARALSYNTFFNFYDFHLMESFIETESTPHLLIETEGSFKHLDNFAYDKNIIDYLNTTGLHIYLKELPYFGLDIAVDAAAGVINCNNDKTIKEAIDKIKPTIIGFDLTDQNLKKLVCYEFEKISNFVKNNDLTNVTVFCGQYQIDTVLQHKYPNIKLKLADVGHTVIARNSKDDYFSFMSYNKNTPVPDAGLIKYKFWCGNKSYEGYRQLVAAYMLDKPALLSYHHRNFDYSIIFNHKELHLNDCEYFWANINHRIWFDFVNLKDKDLTVFYKLLIGIRKLENLKTLTIDKSTTDPNFQEWLNPGDWVAKDDPVPLEHYASCFCAVVTESLFAFPFGNFCDKVVNAVKCYRPIVLVGCPRTLEYMQKKGFKTFSDYWDESYDQELNHEQRLLKIFKVIDSINKKPLEELKYMYNDMLPILQHNHKIVGTFALTKSW